MNLCQTCKFWNRETEYGSEYDLGLGRCKRIPEFWMATTWDDEGERVLSPEFADCKAFSQDGSDYHSVLYSAPDFGCVMHQAKE